MTLNPQRRLPVIEDTDAYRAAFRPARPAASGYRRYSSDDDEDAALKEALTHGGDELDAWARLFAAGHNQ